MINPKKINDTNEQKFTRLLEIKGIKYIYQPGRLSLGIIKYKNKPKIAYPDYYLPDYDLYVELISTKQCFNQSKFKFSEMNKKLLKLVVMTPEGHPYGRRKSWKDGYNCFNVDNFNKLIFLLNQKE